MAWIRKLDLAAAGLASAFAGVHAEPAVVFDRGPSRPLTDYLQVPVAPRFPPLDLSRVRPDPRQPQPGPRFPVVTPGLSPGPVPAAAVTLPQLAGTRLFLAGCDSYSKAWLARHAGRLRELNAVGLVVQAETARDLAELQALAPGIPLTALNAGELARLLGLTHYPVLVSAGRIEQ